MYMYCCSLMFLCTVYENISIGQFCLPHKRSGWQKLYFFFCTIWKLKFFLFFYFFLPIIASSGCLAQTSRNMSHGYRHVRFYFSAIPFKTSFHLIYSSRDVALWCPISSSIGSKVTEAFLKRTMETAGVLRKIVIFCKTRPVSTQSSAVFIFVYLQGISLIPPSVLSLAPCSLQYAVVVVISLFHTVTFHHCVVTSHQTLRMWVWH